MLKIWLVRTRPVRRSKKFRENRILNPRTKYKILAAIRVSVTNQWVIVIRVSIDSFEIIRMHLESRNSARYRSNSRWRLLTETPAQSISPSPVGSHLQSSNVRSISSNVRSTLSFNKLLRNKKAKVLRGDFSRWGDHTGGVAHCENAPGLWIKSTMERNTSYNQCKILLCWNARSFRHCRTKRIELGLILQSQLPPRFRFSASKL